MSGKIEPIITEASQILRCLLNLFNFKTGISKNPNAKDKTVDGNKRDKRKNRVTEPKRPMYSRPETRRRRYSRTQETKWILLPFHSCNTFLVKSSICSTTLWNLFNLGSIVKVMALIV